MMDVWRRRETILLSLRSSNCFNNSNGSSTQLVPLIQCRIQPVYLGLVFCNRSCHFRNCFQKNCFYIEMVTRQILSAFAAVGELYKLPDSKSPHPTLPPFLKVGLCQKKFSPRLFCRSMKANQILGITKIQKYLGNCCACQMSVEIVFLFICGAQDF